jgi:hypothetical protein
LTLMIPESFVPVKSTLTRKPSLLDLTLSIWMKTKRKCFRNVERGLPTLEAKKPSARLVKRNSKKLVGLPNYRKGGS